MEADRRSGESNDAQRRALRRARVLHRLEILVDEARKSPFALGARVSQPVEVQRLQRRVRDVSERWAPVWTTNDAARAGADERVQLEHVTPVVVLVERLLLGDSIEAVLGQAVICRVTYSEHKTRLAVAFRDVHADLYRQMLTCPIDELSVLAWERYRRAGLEPYALSPQAELASSGAREAIDGVRLSGSESGFGGVVVPDERASVDEVLEFASTYNAYELVASETRELEALVGPIYGEVSRTGRVPDWVQVDLARATLFYAYRADHFGGGYGPYEPMRTLVAHIHRLSGGLVDRRPTNIAAN